MTILYLFLYLSDGNVTILDKQERIRYDSYEMCLDALKEFKKQNKPNHYFSGFCMEKTK